MVSEWRITSLGEAINLKRGYDLAEREREPGSIPIISSSGRSGMHSKSMVKGPGVITGRYGTIGLVHFIATEYWPLNTTLYVQDFKGNDPRFVYYLLKTIRYRDYLDKAAVPGINRNDVHRAEIYLPPLLEQIGISRLLTSLDEKVEQLRNLNKTMEQIARAIFKSWFLDFDPVRAKAEGREPEGMDAAIAALFPDLLDHDLPKLWSREQLGTISTIGIGKTPPRVQSHWFSESNDDVVWVSIRDMGRAGTYISDSAERLTTEAVTRFNVRIVPDNTVILSFKLTVGRVSITDGQLTTNEAIAHCVLSEESSVSTEYLYCALSWYDFSSLASTSSIAEAVNSKSIRAINVTVPCRPVSDAFSRTVRPIFQSIKNSQRMASTLGNLRDSLLPRLMSGKIRVLDAEKMVEAVL